MNAPAPSMMTTKYELVSNQPGTEPTERRKQSEQVGNVDFAVSRDIGCALSALDISLGLGDLWARSTQKRVSTVGLRQGA